MEFSSSKNQHKIIRWASQCALWVVNRGSREEKPLGLVSYIWEYPISTPKMGIWALFGMECIENRSAAKKLSEKSLTAQFQELNAPKMVFSFSLAAEQIWLSFGVRLLPSRSRCTGWNSNTNTWKDQEYKESRFDWLKQDSKSVTIMEVCGAKSKTRRKRSRPSKKTSSSHDPASNATRALHCRCHLSVFFFEIWFRKLFWLCQQCDGDCNSEWNLSVTVGALDCGGVVPKIVTRRGLRRRIPAWRYFWFSDRGRIFFFKFSPGGPTCLSTTSTWAEKDSCLDQSQYSKARLLSKPGAAALAHKVAGSWVSQRQGSPPLPSSPRYFDFFFHSTQTSRLQATGWTFI